MFYRVTYLMESMYFDNFEQLKRYFSSNADNLYDLQEELKVESCGNSYPIITEIKEW